MPIALHGQSWKGALGIYHLTPPRSTDGEFVLRYQFDRMETAAEVLARKDDNKRRSGRAQS